MNKLLALLKSLGVSDADAKKIVEESKNDDSQFDVQPLIDGAIAHQRKLFENDVDIIEKFKGEERGKQLDIISRDLKKTFGLASEDIKDKSVKEIIEIARTRTVSGADKSVNDLQTELLAAHNKIKDFEENVIPQTRAEVEVQKKRVNIENELTKLIGSKKLRVPFDAAFPSIVNHLSEKYDLDIDEKKQLNVFLKGSKVQPTKDDKTGLLGLGDILDSKLKEWKFVEESNADKGGEADKKIIKIEEGDNNKKSMQFPGAQKALEALEAAKSAPTE